MRIAPCIVVLASLVAAAADPGADERRPDLPVRLIAWECNGDMAAGGEWTGSKVELGRGSTRFAEVVIRFGQVGLSPDEARWFETPTVAPVAGFVAWEQYCSDACRDEIVREVVADDADRIIARATGGRTCRERVTVDQDGNRSSRVALEVVAMDFRSPGSGLIVLPMPDAGRLACADDEHAGQSPETEWWINEDHDLEQGTVERLEPGVEAVVDPEETARLQKSAAEVLRRLRRLIASRRPDPGTVLVGPAAIRLAEVETRELATLCGITAARGDEDESSFPSAFPLLASVAPRGDIETTAAVEARYSQSRAERELALRLLGDAPAPRQRDAIVAALSGLVTSSDATAASLALRALWKADAAEARRHARPLLHDDRLWRSACGVFVLSDPELERRFAAREVIDLAVRDEIVESLEADPGP